MENEMTDTTATETAPEMLQRLGMDGKLWADEFNRTAISLGYQSMDEGWLIGWFCNAIMAGYDTAQRRYDPDYHRPVGDDR
jgi:hypothetical protein